MEWHQSVTLVSMPMVGKKMLSSRELVDLVRREGRGLQRWLSVQT